jgi:hypothetical protein
LKSNQGLVFIPSHFFVQHPHLFQSKETSDCACESGLTTATNASQPTAEQTTTSADSAPLSPSISTHTSARASHSVPLAQGLGKREIELLARLQESERALAEAETAIGAHVDALRNRDELLQKSTR